MASRAGDILMSALEGESGRVVIEQRRLPLIGAVTRLAFFLSVTKLVCVWILMTIPAFLRCFGEVYVAHREFKIRWSVAIGAGYCAMRTRQWKRGCVMIELRQILPLLRRVACTAPKQVTVRISRIHSRDELPVMHIFVTGCAA